MIQLYQFELSPFCDKVRRVLRYKQLSFEICEVPLAGARKHSPTGKLPALRIDDRVLDDSTQIARFLEERFPEPRLIPAGPRERALCHVLEDWADESLYFYELGLHFTSQANAEKRAAALSAAERPPQKLFLSRVLPAMSRHLLWAQGTGRRGPARIREDVVEHAKAIAALLTDRPFLIDHQLSLADIAVFVQVVAMCGTPQGREAFGREPAIEGWMQRVRERTGG